MTDSLPYSSNQLSLRLTKRIRQLAVVTMVAASTFAALEAEAKRLGGGRSVGRQSQTMQRDAVPPAQQAARPGSSGQQAPAGAQAQRAQGAQAAPAAAPSRSRWLGPIAGLAAGLGIAALLSHLGLGAAFASAMANVIIVALLAVAGIWLVRKVLARTRRESALAYGGNGAHGHRAMAADGVGVTAGGVPGGASAGLGGRSAVEGARHVEPDAGLSSLPPGFDVEAFVQHAKVNFVRLQAAADAGDLADIRALTTPEMFAALKVDLDVGDAGSNRTDVVQLNAELLGLEDRGTEYVASVRFSGLIRESSGAPAESFEEVWNLAKSAQPGEGWMLAGIQQALPH